MGSLIYEIAQQCKEIKAADSCGASKVHKTTEKSWKSYLDHAVKFGCWCRSNYKCRHYLDCKDHIQDYATWLTEQGYSASTIHTYLAGVCRIWGVPMAEIDMPRRVTSANTRSRGTKAVDARTDASRDASPRLYDFAAAVGCRRAEYAKLRGDDLVRDESGYLCVRIRRGKGGKYQEQRILPGDEIFVSFYFDDSNQRIFTRGELNNKIDLHHLRALQSQRAYRYYLGRLQTEADYRSQLEQEIKARWVQHNKRRWDQHEFEGTYRLRGANRRLAVRLGLPTQFDRLAVMAVSVFHLSHWRLGVTVSNYLLAGPWEAM